MASDNLVERVGYFGPDADGDWVVDILGTELAFAVADEDKARRIANRIETLTAALLEAGEALTNARPFLVGLTKQGEDNIWRPAQRNLDAFDATLDRINSLKRGVGV